MSLHPEGVIDNIAAWKAGGEKLDVIALYEELARRFNGPLSPTDYCALLLAEVDAAEAAAPEEIDQPQKGSGC